MIRAIITAHISKTDVDILSLQVNGSDLSSGEADEPINRVISGNREIHLIAGFYSVSHDRNERRFISEQSRIFKQLFADLQTQGLSALPQLADKYFPQAAFLLLASSEMVLIWQDSQKGAYLLRDKKLYRLQPTQRPLRLWPQDWMSYGDFYAFVPQENDLLIFLSPEFVDRFKPQQLEEVFASKQQLFAMVNELNRLGQTYGFDFEQSWLALEVERLEINKIYKGHAEANLSPEVRRISRSESFSKAIPRSKVSRILHGQELIPVKQRKPDPAVHVPDVSDSRPRPQLGDWQRYNYSRANTQINLVNEYEKQARRDTITAYEQRRDPLDDYFEKVRDFSFEPYKGKARRLLYKFFHLWPEQPFISKFFATSLIVLILLSLALGLKTLAQKRKAPKHEEVSEVESTVEPVVNNAEVRAPLETNLEVNHVVKVNNLQLRQAPDSSSLLIGSLKRGEPLVQLAEIEDGWVYVRSQAGLEGYVYALYLFPEETEPLES